MLFLLAVLFYYMLFAFRFDYYRDYGAAFCNAVSHSSSALASRSLNQNALPVWSFIANTNGSPAMCSSIEQTEVTVLTGIRSTYALLLLLRCVMTISLGVRDNSHSCQPACAVWRSTMPFLGTILLVVLASLSLVSVFSALRIHAQICYRTSAGILPCRSTLCYNVDKFLRINWVWKRLRTDGRRYG